MGDPLKLKFDYSFKKLADATDKQAAKMLNKIAAAAREDIKQGTRAGLDVRNQPFEPLADSTKKSKRRRGKRIRPLFDENVMVRGTKVTQRAKKADLTAIVEPGRNIRKRGVVIPALHDFGDGRLPQRAWFGLSKRVGKKISEILSKGGQEWIKSGKR